VRKQLTCPACGVVMADATYRRWPGDLRLTSPDGARLQPEGGAVLLRQVGAGGADPDREDYLRRHLGELFYDLRCRNGHRVLRTMPHLVRAIRRAGGRWVDPS
jgi:hypothetical protein